MRAAIGILIAIMTLSVVGGLTITPSLNATAQSTIAVEDMGDGVRCYARGTDGLSCVVLPPGAPTLTPVPTATPVPVTEAAEITAPVPGSLFTSSTVTFTWTRGINVSEYWLWVSTVPGDGNLYSQGQGSSQAATVSGIPTNVRVYVRLWSLAPDGEWLFRDYQYGP